jgi:OOP family OmpA-OmpF porin
MPTASSHKFRQLAIVTAVLATLPAALAQQGKPSEAALPPPSLYDELMPPERAAGPAPAPAKPAPAPQAKAPAPAPTAAKQPAPAPAKQAEAKEPWYKSMFSWMGGGEAKPAQSKMLAAPSTSTAAYTAGPATNEYALYDPNRVVRGGFGQCVRTGWWRGSSADPCAPEAAAKKPAAQPTQVAAAAPTPVARPEPVEVQPLTPAPVREERALAPEPAAAAAPLPAPVPAPAPAPAVESMTLSADAMFALSSATLKPTAMERLDQLASRMLAMDYQTIRVVGHTDPTGSPEMNEKLSLKRAEAVKRYLVAKGVDPNAFVIEGMGSAMPVVTDKDCGSLPRDKKIACYQPDRRVEIEVVGAPAKSSSAAQPAVARNQ